MKREEKILLSGLIIVVLVSCAGIYLSQQKAEAESVLSFDKINVVSTENVGWHQMENGWYKNKVKGKWVGYVNVNHPTTIDLIDNGAETNAPNSKYGEGAKFRAKERVRVTASPYPAYFIGDVDLRGWSYSDSKSNNYERVFPWYVVTNWSGVAAPYHLKVMKGISKYSMELVGEEDIVVGPSWYPPTTPSASFSTGVGKITVRNLTISSTGGLEPEEDLALVWDKDGNKKVIREEDLTDQFGEYGEPTMWWNADDHWKELLNNIDFGEIETLGSIHNRTFGGQFEGNLPSRYIGSEESLKGGIQRCYFDYVPTDDPDKAPAYIDNYFPAANFSELGVWDKGRSSRDFPWLLQAKGGDEWSAKITIEADASAFDTVVWLPSSGDAKITNVPDLKVYDGSTGTLVVTVKNVGSTPAKLQGTVEPPTDVEYLGGDTRKTVGDGNYTTMTFSLRPNLGNEEKKTKTGTVTVRTDRGSGTPSTKNFDITILPSDGDHDGGTGDVTGRVVDARNGEPIVDATVSTDLGNAATGGTDQSGSYEITDAREGMRTITAYKGGYNSKGVTVHVDPNTPNPAPMIELSEKGGGFPWVWVIVGVGIAGTIIAFIYLRRRGIIEA